MYASKASPLLALPNEILLIILDNFSDPPRICRRELINTSLTCRQLRALCAEQLLLAPIAYPWNMQLLVKAYLQNPRIARKVRTVEFIGFESRTLQSWARLDTCFKIPEAKLYNCATIVKGSTMLPSMAMNDWLEDAKKGLWHAHFTTLLAMLPSLENLLLGLNTHSSVPWLFDDAKPHYLQLALRHIAAKARTVELPLIGSTWGTGVDFSSFPNIRKLSVSLPKILTFVFPRLYSAGSTWPRFPGTLHSLVLTVRGDYDFFGLLPHLEHILEFMPGLRTLNVYVTGCSPGCTPVREYATGCFEGLRRKGVQARLSYLQGTNAYEPEVFRDGMEGWWLSHRKEEGLDLAPCGLFDWLLEEESLRKSEK
jgi:hypothetical protein